ncbi:MAG: translation initiation factor IF-2 [Lachnospiraceae bacterium]|nr:translation initiation factor IF-2 [Lachnospiraceae bacterium]
MAKMKIYELAKEIDKTNKEILTFLTKKGIEAKSHMNTLDEDTVEMVRKAFLANKEGHEEVKKAEPKAEPPKKKKSIIFVSNPHNSKMPGARPQGNGQRPQKNRPGKPAEKEPNPFRPQVPKPVVKPVVIERTEPSAPSNDTRRPVQKNENQRQEQSRNYRQDGNRQQQGMGRGNGSNERNNNQGYQKNNDNRRDGAASRGGSKPYNNNERGGRPNAGEKINYKKPQPQKSFSDGPIGEPEKRRDEEKRRQGQERDKRSKKDLIYEEDNANIKGKNKAGKFIKPEKKVVEKAEEQIKVITLPESLTIKELAEKMKLQPSAIVKKLFLQGQIVTVNQEIDYETAEEIAIEYEIICEKEVKVDVIEELLKEEEEAEESMEVRPPVICVMGHVDHGKTSLLDAIRKTNVTDREAGGITQHIGAYTVTINGQKITFLDTPGHEAFTSMRMRGANATDIAILVVAADDGVMPQTVEAISHAKAAGIEIIVAVNKIDKPNANIDRVKQELAEYELIPEDWGGSTVFAPVSAKSGEGIEQLLEMILLTADILELKANPKRRARGLVIEAELDKGRGPVATILVQKGTLKVGDFVSAGASHGKIRAMIDDKGRRVKEAAPSTPVEILGLSDVPGAGEIFIAHENDKTARSFAETFIAQNKEKKLEETKSKMSLDDLFTQIQTGNLKELNLIIKADVQGSVEAVKQSLSKLSNEEVIVKCIHGGVGAINESDVMLASTSNAIIIGFNVRVDATAKATAEREGVDVRLYKVIYQAIEDVEAAMKGMLDPIFEEQVIGHAEVRQIFKASAVGNIAGSYVLDGRFERGCKVRISREGEQIYEGELASLKRFKDDVKEVKAGFECGLVFEGFDSMKELDIVEAYIMVEVPR